MSEVLVMVLEEEDFPLGHGDLLGCLPLPVLLEVEEEEVFFFPMVLTALAPALRPPEPELLELMELLDPCDE